MVKTVKKFFDDFCTEVVQIEPERTQKARTSRDWLLENICNLSKNDESFPQLYEGRSIKYGSFARKTKIRPLDDIDLMIALHGCGGIYSIVTTGEEYTICMPDSAERLIEFRDASGLLNSRKLLDCFKNALSNIEGYSKADIHRNHEAVTLQLKSYEWNFDIVPCFYTDTGYYLIPDGKGNWKPTDPRIDQDRVTQVNQKHSGKLLPLIRLLKYWKKQNIGDVLGSYVFETMILDYFENQPSMTEDTHFYLHGFWEYMKDAIYYPINDPKQFQGDMNTLDDGDKNKISMIAFNASRLANGACQAETLNYDTEGAVEKWRQIFGCKFPKYER